MGPAAAGMTLPAAGAPRGEVPGREVLRTASVLVGPALMLAAALVRRAALPLAAVVRMAAAMLQAVPALASTEAHAATEFGADDVPAGTTPAVVVPTVIVAIDREFFDVRRCRWRLAEVWICGETCIDDLRIDLGQRDLGVVRLRLVLRDRPDAIDHEPGARHLAVVDKSCVLAGVGDPLARPGSLRGSGYGLRQQRSEREQTRRQAARGRRREHGYDFLSKHVPP